jgi:hypothetical protein
MKLIDLVRDEWMLVNVSQTHARYQGRRLLVFVSVPLSEIGEARLLPVEKGTTLLKWIRVTYDGLVALGGGNDD